MKNKNKNKIKKGLLLMAATALIIPIATPVIEVEASSYSWSKYNTVTKRSLSYNDAYSVGQVPHNYYNTVGQVLNSLGLSSWNVSTNQVFSIPNNANSGSVFWIDSDTYFLPNASNMERPMTPRIAPNASLSTYIGSLYSGYIFVYNPTTKQYLSLTSIQEGNLGGGGRTYTIVNLARNEWTYSYSRGTLVGNVIASQYAYVDNARNSDGYWYVRGSKINTAPTMNAISSQTVENGSSINVTPTIADVDGDVLTLSASSSNTGIATVTTNNTLKRYTITGVKKGIATITATVTDSSGAVATRTFNVTVTNVAPTNKATIPAQTIDGKGKTATVNLANYFQDADGDALTYTASSNSTSRVTTSISGNTLTLNGIDKGSSTITVTAKDSTGASVSQTFTTTVNNTAPTNKTTIPAQTIIGKGQSKTVDLSNYFQDIDSDDLTYIVSSNATSKVTTSVSGSTLTLNSIDKGSATITVTAKDTNGATITQTFVTTVENARPSNKITIPTQTIDGKGKSKNINLSNYFEDLDDDTLTYTVSSNATSKVTTSVSGSTLTLNGIDKGSAMITVTAKDTSGATVSQTFTTTVNNSVPVSKTTIPVQIINGKDETTNLDLSNYFDDVDGDSLTYTVSSNASSRVSTSVSGNLLTLVGVSKGSATITVTAKDTSGATVSQTFTTTVNNTAPSNKSTILSQTISGKGKTTILDLSDYFNDIDNDSITYTATSNDTNKVKTSISGNMLTLSGVDKGSATITVSAMDVSGATVIQTFKTTVNNTAPTNKTNIPSQVIDGKGKSTILELSDYFQDIDNDELTYSINSSDKNKVGTSITGSKLTLNGIEKGSVTITITAKDSTGTSISQTFTTTVNNTVPTNKNTISSQTIEGKGKSTILDLTSYFQDVDGDTLTYTISSSETNYVNVVINNNSLVLNGINKGLSTIIITAKDSSGASVKQTFTTTVKNTAPINKNTISSQIIDGKRKSKTIKLSDYFEDVDGDSLSYTVVSSEPNKVSAAIKDDSIILTGVDKGSANITVTVKDSSNEVVTQTFTTTVNVPEPIIKKPIPLQEISGVGQIKELNLEEYFEDVDGNILTYSINSNTTNKIDTSISNGKLLLKGISKGSHIITVTATNIDGESISQTFTTNVNNTVPTLDTNFNNLNLKVGEISNPILLESSDIDNDILNYIVTSDNTEIAKTIIVDNKLTVQGLKEGKATITVKVLDGESGNNNQSTKTFTVDVFEPAPIGPSEPIIDMDNSGTPSNGQVQLDDYFTDENPSDLIFTPNIIINEPEADIYIQDNVLVIENPKQDGMISVDVEAMNKKGKIANAIFNLYLYKNMTHQQATLKLVEGEFTLKTMDVKHFGQINLTAAKQTVTTDFTGDFGVIDARGTQEGWNVTVTATPFEVETFNGFIGTPHQLPVGSLALNNPLNIERIGHVNKTDGLPTTNINDYTVLDNGAVSLLNASQGEGLGEFQFNFENALSLTVDAVTAKIDTVNYPDQNTPYVSTVTWDLVSGPQF